MNFHQVSRLLATSAASALTLAMLSTQAPAQSPTPDPAQPSAAPVAATPAAPAQAAAPTAPAPQATATPAPASTAQPAAQPGSAAANTAPTPTLSAADIQGLDVFGSDGQQVGKVIGVNQSDGAVKSIDVQSNGYFGFFKNTYEIPANAVKKNGAKLELSMSSGDATRVRK